MTAWSKSASALIEVAERGIGAAAIVEQIGIVRHQLDGPVVIVERPGVILPGSVGPAAVVIDLGVIGLELDGLIVVVDGEIVVLGLGEGEAAGAIDGRVARVELERPVEVGDGVLVLAVVLAGDAAVEIGERGVGLRFLAAGDDLAATGDGESWRVCCRSCRSSGAGRPGVAGFSLLAEARAQQQAAVNPQARPLQRTYGGEQAHGATQQRRGGDGRQAPRPAYLAAHGVEKSFGGRMVVRGVTLYVRRGEAVGLLGPNGAGKTTVFYMITGLINADRGRIELDGYDVTRAADVSARPSRHWLSAAGSVDLSRP